jgi:hypothetical protein
MTAVTPVSIQSLYLSCYSSGSQPGVLRAEQKSVGGTATEKGWEPLLQGQQVVKLHTFV